jgi:hypothetical protein
VTKNRIKDNISRCIYISHPNLLFPPNSINLSFILKLEKDERNTHLKKDPLINFHLKNLSKARNKLPQRII